MRLIDADAILKKLKQSAEIFLCGRDFKDLLVQDKARVDEIYNCQAEIINAPTIDRPTRSQFKRMAVQLGYEPVIHCRECKHYQNHPNGLCYAHTEPDDNERGYKGEAVCVEPEDFCSYGERKKNGNEDRS